MAYKKEEKQFLSPDELPKWAHFPLVSRATRNAQHVWSFKLILELLSQLVDEANRIVEHSADDDLTTSSEKRKCFTSRTLFLHVIDEAAN